MSTDITIQEAAERMNEPMGKVRAWAKHGLLPGAFQHNPNKPNDPWYIPEEAVDNWLKQNEITKSRPLTTSDISKVPSAHAQTKPKVDGSSPDDPEPGPPTWWLKFKNNPWIYFPRLIIGGLIALIIFVGSIGSNFEKARLQLIEWNIVRPFPPASDDEILIVISTFHRPENVRDSEPHKKIARAIEESAKRLEIDNLRVEVNPRTLTSDERGRAELIGIRYNASMIIWGEDTDVELIVNFFNLKQPDFEASDVEIREVERSHVANPSAYAQLITKDLPGQLNFLALFGIGQSYFEQQDYRTAIRVIEEATDSLNAAAPPLGAMAAYFRLGWLYQELGDLSLAIDAYSQASQLNPEVANIYNNRGIAYADQGNLTEAMADLNKAIQIDPQLSHAYNNRGTIYLAQGDPNLAIAEFNKAIQLEPQSANAYNNRGLAYIDLGDIRTAIADYDLAIQLSPGAPVPYYNRGNAYLAQEDLIQAIADYDQAIQLNPQYVKAYQNRGIAYVRQRDFDQAIDSFSIVIKLDPLDPDSYKNRGLTYRDKAAFEQAIIDLQHYLEMNPNAADRQSIEAIINELED